MKTATPKTDALERLQDGIARLTSSEDWLSYLRVQSRFYRYSANNCMLIALQMPEATQVAGYRRWRELGRQVVKGAKGLLILAPCKYRTTIEATEPDGEDVKVDTVRGFRAAYVFDISQTEGDPLPQLPISRLEGDPPAVIDALTWYATELGFSTEFSSFSEPNKNGETDFLTHRVTIREGLSPAQVVKTLAHELGHILLAHDGATCALSLAELEAESTAFVVCDALDIDASDYSFAYCSSWRGGGDEAIAAIKASASRIGEAARSILDQLASESGTP